MNGAFHAPPPRYFPGSAATASGRFVQKPARRARDGAFTYPPLSETGPMFCSFPFAKRRPVFRPEQTGRKKRRAPSASPAGILHCPLQSRVPKRGGGAALFGNPHKKRRYAPPSTGRIPPFLWIRRSGCTAAQKPARDRRGLSLQKSLSRTQRPPATAKQAAKRVRKRPLQNPSMPRQRRGPRPAGRAARQSAPAPATKQRHTGPHAASKASPPRREAGGKAKAKRPIPNPTMPRQRRGPRPAGRAAQQSAPTTRQRHTARTRRARRRRPRHEAGGEKSKEASASEPLHAAPKARSPPCRAGSAAIRTRSRHKAAAYRPARGEQSVAAPPRSRWQSEGETSDSKSHHAAPKARPPPCRAGGAAIRTRTGAARPAFHGRAARRFFKTR